MSSQNHLRAVPPDSNNPPMETAPPPTRAVKLPYIINRINFLNFNDSTVQVVFRHKTYVDKFTVLEGWPEPSTGASLTCRWKSPPPAGLAQTHHFENILLPDDSATLRVRGPVQHLDEEGIEIILAAEFDRIQSRRFKRMPVAGVTVQVVQGGTVFSGTLLDFSSASFRVRISPCPDQRLSWIDESGPATIILHRESRILFSGICSITCRRRMNVILKPATENVRKFPPKKFRSNRYKLQPSPVMAFIHPLNDLKYNLKISDISGTGFQTEEEQGESTLIPGLVLPEVSIHFNSQSKLNCTCQVIYRNHDPESGTYVYGLSILDMAPEDHIGLLSILHQTNNENTYINNKVDMNQLWNFFFQTGFIYPEKYLSLSKHKTLYKKMYERLYNDTPNIARHFISQEKGLIHGHLSTLRYYSRTWLIHHHAANKNLSNRAGLDVLDQIHNFLNDSYRIHSCCLDYVICYFRPDNKFPNRVFGGAARNLGNKKGCSVDPMAYLYLDITQSSDKWLGGVKYHLARATKADLQELEFFYEHQSGGLLFESLDIHAESSAFEELALAYKAIGMIRDRHFYTLRSEQGLHAVIMLNLSDGGLNMSDLTSAFTVFALDMALPSDYLLFVLKTLAIKYVHAKVPVMIFPVDYATSSGISFDKTYNLWSLSMDVFDEYLNFCNRLFNRIK